MKTAAEINEGLSQFTGTCHYYRHSPRLLLTDGVAWLCNEAGCFWLVDIIASYQPQCRRDEMLAGIQFWTLKVNPDKSAVVTCDRDTNDTAIKQVIEYTDFPLPEIKLYCAANGDEMVVLLPSEY